MNVRVSLATGAPVLQEVLTAVGAALTCRQTSTHVDDGGVRIGNVPLRCTTANLLVDSVASWVKKVGEGAGSCNFLTES